MLREQVFLNAAPEYDMVYGAPGLRHGSPLPLSVRESTHWTCISHPFHWSTERCFRRVPCQPLGSNAFVRERPEVFPQWLAQLKLDVDYWNLQE